MLSHSDILALFTPKVEDPHAELKTLIRRYSHIIRDETVRFLEQYAELARRHLGSISPYNQKPPRLPVFYVKAFNQLQRICRVVGPDYKCPILELVPWAIEVCWKTEMEAEHEMPRLVRMDDGCFLDENQPENAEELLAELCSDVADYFQNHFSLAREWPRMPIFVEFMRRYLEQNYSNQSFGDFGQKLNDHLTLTVGEDRMPCDYFKTRNCP